MEGKQPPLAIRLDASLPSIDNIKTTIQQKKKKTAVESPLLSLPLYLVERLASIVDEYLS